MMRTPRLTCTPPHAAALGGGMEKNEVAATRAKSLWLAPLGVTDHYAMLHSL